MPFCDYVIFVPANKVRFRDLHKKGLVENPAKLDGNLKNRRLILGLTQEQVAVRLGVLREVYDRWERNERVPVVSVWPSIIAFLGHYPCQPVSSAADLVLMARRITGLDQKAFARRVGVIHQKLRRWERGFELPDAVSMHRLRESLSPSTSAPSRHESPHKPVLLLAVLDLFARGETTPDHIEWSQLLRQRTGHSIS